MRPPGFGESRVCAKAGSRRGFRLRAGAQRKSSRRATEGRHCQKRRSHAFDRAKLCAAKDPRTVEGGWSDHDSTRPCPPLASPGGEDGASSACFRGTPAASWTRGERAGLAAVWRGRRAGARWEPDRGAPEGGSQRRRVPGSGPAPPYPFRPRTLHPSSKANGSLGP